MSNQTPPTQPVGAGGDDDLEEIMEDLAVGHNFDYARRALLAWRQSAVKQAELQLLQRIESMGDSETKRQGVHTAHNMDGYHRAYGEIVSYNVHNHIAQLQSELNQSDDGEVK